MSETHICNGMEEAKERFRHFSEPGWNLEFIIGFDEFGDAFVSQMVMDENGEEVQRDTISAYFCPYCGIELGCEEFDQYKRSIVNKALGIANTDGVRALPINRTNEPQTTEDKELLNNLIQSMRQRGREAKGKSREE